MQKLRIFAASPSDMATERAKVETVAAMLKPLADNLGIVLDVADWRAVVPNMGRPEQAILDQLKPTDWDVLIGILWHRFGTTPGSKDPQTQKDYLSGTEEEFRVAYRLWQQTGKPRIMMYRCTRNVPLDALDPDQFKAVKEFFAQFDAVKGEHPGLSQSFDTTEAFEKLLLDNLQRLLLDHGVQTFAPKIPNNLPRRAPFFGRDKDMDVALRALSPEDLTWGVLVDGIGGIGKSALAVEAAYRCKEKGRFDAFIFVSAKQNILDPHRIRERTPVARTLDEFFNETARVLGQTGIPRLADVGKRRALLDALRVTRALLVYDNLETLTKEEQEAMADFLRELPQGCKAITTSRRRGGEGGEWLRLEQLEWEAARAIIENEIARDARLANKLQGAAEARWQELYDETKGSPLALVHTLGLMRVRAALSFGSALDLLRSNRDPNLQNFIFEEARRELTDNDEAGLRALSFFVPSAPFEAWMEVAKLSQSALETTIDRLSDLSLVDVLSGEERFALHPLTRNFARDQLLSDVQIAHDTGMRFATYWVTYSQRFGGESYKSYNRLEAEWANLNAAAEWLWQLAALKSGQVDDRGAALILNDFANALCGAAGPLFFIGRWDDVVQLSSRGYELMRAVSSWKEAGWKAYQVAWIHSNRANTGDATRWANICSEAWVHGGNKHEQAVGMRMRGQIAEQCLDRGSAKRLYQDALAIWRDLKSDNDIATVLNDLGNLERGQHDEAELYFRQALALAEKRDMKEAQAYISGNLGLLALDRKRWVEAREWYEKELPFGREVGRLDLIADAKYGLARVHEEEGRRDLALPLAQEALVIDEKLHSRTLPWTRELVERLRKAVEEQ
jgi:tetratricopeptide (TPR) repeat protein